MWAEEIEREFLDGSESSVSISESISICFFFWLKHPLANEKQNIPLSLSKLLWHFQSKILFFQEEGVFVFGYVLFHFQLLSTFFFSKKNKKTVFLSQLQACIWWWMWGIDERYNLVVEDASEESTEEVEEQEEGDTMVDDKLLEKQKANQVISLIIDLTLLLAVFRSWLVFKAV